jgi:hypothetical protein
MRNKCNFKCEGALILHCNSVEPTPDPLLLLQQPLDIAPKNLGLLRGR